MPMHLNQTITTSRIGINHVCNLIARQQCTFQEIDQHNDIGNDAYIEFFADGIATGCCIAAQIKTGDSYISRSTGSYFIPADRNHFEYWHSHILPVVGIVYDPDADRVRWVDITAYLRDNPHLIEHGPYTIHIADDHILDNQTFRHFQEHFLSYRDSYAQTDKLGDALERFSHREDVDACRDGLQALFSYHRHRVSSWYYLISCFRHFRGHRLLPHLISKLCMIPGHMDIFWHRENMIQEDILVAVQELLATLFSRDDVLILMEITSLSGGFQRGSVGQGCDAIIGILRNRDEVLESIAFDVTVNEEIRYFSIMLLVSYVQSKSVERCYQLIHRYKEAFPDCEDEVGGLTRIMHVERKSPTPRHFLVG